MSRPCVDCCSAIRHWPVTYSPLGFAVREGHLEAVQVLLGAGANPDQMASGGDTLIEVARTEASTRLQGRSMRHSSAAGG